MQGAFVHLCPQDGPRLQRARQQHVPPLPADLDHELLAGGHEVELAPLGKRQGEEAPMRARSDRAAGENGMEQTPAATTRREREMKGLKALTRGVRVGPVSN